MELNVFMNVGRSLKRNWIIFLLADDNVEKTERLDQAERKASQAMLTQREKEIELEALQKYFKSTEVELHRWATVECLRTLKCIVEKSKIYS